MGISLYCANKKVPDTLRVTYDLLTIWCTFDCIKGQQYSGCAWASVCMVCVQVVAV